MFSNNPHAGPLSGLDRGFGLVFDSDMLRSTDNNYLCYRAANALIRRSVLADYVEPQGRISSEQRTLDAVTKWLKTGAAGKGRPYFAFVNFWTVHPPRIPPIEHLRAFVHEGRLARIARDFGDPPVERFNTGVQKPSSNEVLHIHAVYAAALHYLDCILAQFLKLLTSERVLDDTVIVVTADHGESMGEHGLWAHQLSLHDPLIRVPLIVVGPGLPQHQVYEEPVQLQDLFNTFLTLAGVPSGEYPVQTRRPNLLDGLNGTRHEDAAHQYAFSEFYDDGGGLTQRLLSYNPAFDTSALAGLYSVRTRRYKYIKAAEGADAFYDCLADPLEQRNLVDSPPPVVETLKQELAGWQASLHRFDVVRAGA